MSINVKYEPSYQAITVRGGYWDEEGVFWQEWCNHHGSEEQDTYDASYDSGRETLTEWESVWLVCDKCDEAVAEIGVDDGYDG